jgi:tellurite resistance protein TerC
LNISELIFFGGFLLFISILLTLDLGVFNKEDHVVTTRQAAIWTTVWVALALLFYYAITVFGDKIHGITTIDDLKRITSHYKQSLSIDEGNFAVSIANYRKIISLEFLAGYVVEESLSVDNLFVILLILTSFGVEKKLYHRVLFWGIIGALVMRFLFIFTGAFLVTKFSWILYLFAAFLIFTGVKMFFSKEDDNTIDTEKHPVVRFASKYFRVLPNFDGNKFFTKQNGLNYITPLFIVLMIVEVSDLIFAVDSIPAIFAITKDPYIVFFSNIFAILGLRSMFFLLLSVFSRFHYFKTGLSFLLTFIGVKMLFEEQLKEMGFTIGYSLLVIVGILFSSIVLSLLFPKKENI